MSSAITRSPRTANQLDAQHVFEPMSSSHWPGRKPIVSHSCLIEVAWTYQ